MKKRMTMQTFREPVQSTCTSRVRKTQFLRKFSGTMPQCRGPPTRTTLCPNVRNRHDMSREPLHTDLETYCVCKLRRPNFCLSTQIGVTYVTNMTRCMLFLPIVISHVFIFGVVCAMLSSFQLLGPCFTSIGLAGSRKDPFSLCQQSCVLA